MKIDTVENLLSSVNISKKISVFDRFNKVKELLALNGNYKTINTRLNYFLNKIDEGIISTDADGSITGLNSKALDLLNIRTAVEEEKNIFKLLPWLRAEYYEKLLKADADSEPLHVSKIILNHELRRVNLNVSLYKTAVNGVISVMLIIKNVTKENRKHSEPAESNAKFKLIAQYSKNLISVLNKDFSVVYLNPSFKRVLGSSSEKYLNASFAELVHPADIKIIGSFDGLVNAEFRINNGGTGWVWVQGSTYSMAPEFPDLLVLSAAEITERKEREKLLLESHEKYRMLIETSPDAVAVIDLKGRILLGNETLVSMLEYDGKDEIAGETYIKHLSKESREGLTEVIKELLSRGRLKSKEFVLISRLGKKVFTEVSVSLLMNKIAQPDSFLVILRDITERKKISDELKYSEMRFRSVWENSNDGMRLTDKYGKIVAVNDAYCRLIGQTVDNIICKPYNVVYKTNEDGNPESFMDDHQRIFNTKEFDLNRRIKVDFGNEKRLTLDVTYSLIEFESYDFLFLGIFRDVTLLKQTEEDLRNSEKLAAIGKMAAYLSHEIKTPLSSIKANLQMLFKDLQIPAVKEKSLAIIQREVKRLDKLLKNVLTFSRQVDLVFVKINMRQLVNNIAELQKPYIENKNIRFVNRVDDVYILGDYPKLHSVFLHLIENSVDAIGEKGEVEISSRKPESNKLIIYVRDTGRGVANGGRIFDPFYTTKASGTGLGLSIAQKIIEQHNGKISLISGEKGNTIFEIILNSEG